MKQQYYFMIAATVLTVGLLTGCGNEGDETAAQSNLPIVETLQGEVEGTDPQAADIEAMVLREIDDYIKNFTGLYTSGTFDDTASVILIEERNYPGDNDNGASLTVYSDLSGERLRYELRCYGETGNQVINYYLCEDFIWISRQSNYYSSWILTVGDQDILYSEITNWIIVGETIYIMHDNGELEETEKAKLEVPMPDDFEAEETMTWKEKNEKAAIVENTGEDNIIADESFDTEEANGRIPVLMQYDPQIMDYDPEDTIYYKTYYDDFVEGKIMNIDYHPHMEIREELEDYFVDDSEIFYLDYLVSMFYDDRTVETDEKELERMFWEHGYLLYFHSVEFQDLRLRFIEIAEKEGLSLYPIRILMQTWDDDHIYLQDITGPIPRKITDLMVVDRDGVWQLIVHSSGFSKEYIPEEELSFWEFTGSYWILVPMELEIDTSHAFSLGNLYPDVDRNELFEMFYYRDGITFRPSMQPTSRYETMDTYRLGIMEITEENKRFRLVAVCDVLGITSRIYHPYIQFTIE